MKFLDRLYPEERVIVVAMLTDYTVGFPLIILGFLSGAAAAASEAIRIILVDGIDWFAFMTLYSVNRGRFNYLEFGTEKVQIVAQIAIAVGMSATLYFVFDKVIAILLVGEWLPDMTILVVFASISFVNFIINVMNLILLRRQQRETYSLILAAQIKNRIVMLLSSAVATVAAAAALIPDRILFQLIDTVGAILVMAIIVWTLVDLIYGGVVTLLDAPVSEREKHLIFAEIAARFDEWDHIEFLRTRRVGTHVYAEIGLGFKADLPLDRALEVCESIEQAIKAKAERAYVSVYPVASSAALPAAGAS